MPFIPRRRTKLEFLDLPSDVCSVDELEGSLADIRTVNRYLGDRWALLKHLSARARGLARITVLDVATGSADLPVTLVEWARKKGIDISVTAVDINSRTIDIARRCTLQYPEIELMVADALELPFGDGSFDFVLCSKTLHHMKEPEGVAALREIMRVARRGYLVMDLQRSWVAYLLIYALTRIFTRNRMTRYDGPLSVLKAFTVEDLTLWAQQAGAPSFRIHREPFWLLVLSGDKS
ncbi:methyltransferase domain-containing protein [Geomonas edaphica]|uniref:methyltransferase domain-containing protein n=1 Tax=Geomonas edaphica TaxID=2570226 RepID=UPI0010A7D0E7|nr:methyltransferase domain-containing protein [Geomonas edaphica]